MDTRVARSRLAVAPLILVGAFFSVRPITAQSPPAPPAPAARPAARPGEVQSDPIRCWWKTDRTAVRVGERFQLVLTCGVIETNRITVAPKIGELEGGAIQITPFEVVSSTRQDDIVVAPWRYLQFEYQVRLLNDGFFGRDVNIPALTVTYNIEAPGGEALGRDQSYVLPPLPMKILSLVPSTAGDIRDASGQTFADIESGRFISTATFVVAVICFIFAAVFVLLAVVRVARTYRARDAKAVRPVAASTSLRGCLRALRGLESEVAARGWSPEIARRALTALRIAGATGLGARVMQNSVARGTAEREGQLAVRTGWLGRERAMLSAPTTSHRIEAALQNGHMPSPRRRVPLEQIGGSLHVLSSAAYGRPQAPDAGTLDSALTEGIEAVKRLHAGARWPVRTMEAVTRSVTGW